MLNFRAKGGQIRGGKGKNMGQKLKSKRLGKNARKNTKNRRK